MPSRAACTWLAVIAGFGAAVGVADLWVNRRHDGSTLSECARATWRTNHPAGRAAFVTLWTLGSALWVWHICWPDSFRRFLSRR